MKLKYQFICAICAIFAVIACKDEDIPDNFYSSTKVTAAGFLQENDETFSEFHEILNRAEYFSMLATYGEYTVFAPTNDAVNTYLTENGYRSVADIPLAICDTLATS